jgi:hypothetical protein
MTRACRPFTAWRRLAAPLCAAAVSFAPAPGWAATCSTLSFVTPPSYFPTTPEMQPSAVVVGDFDRNGTLDVATVNQTTNTIGILPGGGDGTLGAVSAFGTVASPIDIVAGDLDRDGKLDLVVASGSASQLVYVHQGLGVGTLGTGVGFGVGVVPARIGLADFDRDGRLDLVVVSSAGHRVKVFQGNGSTTAPVFGGLLSDLDLSAGSLGPAAAAAGDFDRDGDLDLAVALQLANQVRVFTGSPSGALGGGTNYTVGSQPGDVAAADVDGDGFLDLVVANGASASVSVLEGGAGGTFAAPVAITGVGQPRRVALADLDRDGVLDLAVLDGAAAPRIVTFRGNPLASPLFVATPYAVGLTGSSSPQALAVGDFTSDGRADLVAALWSTSQVALVKNDDSGSTCLASSFGAAPSYGAGSGPVAAAAADLDGDGRPDLVVADQTGSAVSVLRGTPGGYGPPASYAVTPAPRGVATADFDFDGKADVVAALGSAGAGKVKLFMGDGTGLLAAGAEVGAGSNLSAAVVGDFDGNGTPDVAVTSEGTNEVLVLLGDGAGGLGAPIATAVGAQPRALAVGGFGGLGPDLAVSCSGSNAVWVLRRTGPGSFVVGPTPSVGTEPWGLVVGDADGDAFPDIVTADHGGGTVTVLKNDGAGGFLPTTHPVDGSPTGVALLRVDNTARNDIVVSTASLDAVDVLFDNGSGGFDAFDPMANRHPVRSSPQAVVPADVDRDGRLDAVVPCKTSNAVVALLTRPPKFQAAPRVGVGSQPAGAASADLDGDGDLDLAVANTLGNSVTILENESFWSGSFKELGTALPLAAGAAPTSVAAADFDRDGTVDLAVNDAGAGKVAVFRGTGGGAFAAAQSFAAGAMPGALAAAHVDRDGRVDLLVANIVAGRVTRLLNTSTGAGSIDFAAPTASDEFSVGETPTALVAADFDRDGWLDFAVSNDALTGMDSVTVRYADGLGSFGLPVTLDLTVGDQPLSLTGADLDGDGDDDLATANSFTDTLAVFENLGASFDTTPLRVPAPDIAVFVTVADMNRDGAPDLVAAARGLKVLRGRRDLGLTPPFLDSEDFVAGPSPAFAVVGDWNRDGVPDAVVVNEDSNDVSVFLSTACTARRLEVTLQPAACVAGAPFLLQAQVTARDEGGNVAACTAGTVTPAIVPNTGDPLAVLGGPGPQPLAGGVASFANLTIDRPGRRYRLQFTLSGVPAVETRNVTLGEQVAIVGPAGVCPSPPATTYSADAAFDAYEWTLAPPIAPPFAYTPSVALDSPPVTGGPYTLGLAARVDACEVTAARTIWGGVWTQTTLSLSGPWSVCVDCVGGTITATEQGGGAIQSRQWGYRTTALGTITPIPGETGPTYVIKGTDFPGPGSYLVVVTSVPSCPATPSVSLEQPVTVQTDFTNEVQFLAVTSRGTPGNGQSKLQWINSTGTPEKVRIRWNKAPTGTSSCTSPLDPDLGPVSGEVDFDNPPPSSRGTYDHGALELDTAYCYTVFVRKAGWGQGRIVKARPFDASGPVKWAYATGATAVVPPTVGKYGILAMSNDRTIHEITRGAGGGVWPADWVPRPLTGVAHSRSPIVPFGAGVLVSGADSVLFAADDAGDVHAVDAKNGSAIWGPVAPLPGATITGAPGAILQQYGGPRDLILVGTRKDPATDTSVFYGLNLADGTGLASATFSGDANDLGPVVGTPAVDYASPQKRVYFTSRRRGAGDTVWALNVNAVDPAFTKAWSDDLGEFDTSPVLRNGRVYVANTAGDVYSLDAAAGSDTRTMSTADGPVKGFLFPDRRNENLFFATTTMVWSVADTASGFSTNWSWTMPAGSPSIVLYWPQSDYVYVGGGNGTLWQLDLRYLPGHPSFARSWTLGDGTGQIGAPSLDIGVSPPLLVVGSESGVLYGVEVPLP